MPPHRSYLGIPLRTPPTGESDTLYADICAAVDSSPDTKYQALKYLSVFPHKDAYDFTKKQIQNLFSNQKLNLDSLFIIISFFENHSTLYHYCYELWINRFLSNISAPVSQANLLEVCRWVLAYFSPTSSERQACLEYVLDQVDKLDIAFCSVLLKSGEPDEIQYVRQVLSKDHPEGVQVHKPQPPEARDFTYDTWDMFNNILRTLPSGLREDVLNSMLSINDKMAAEEFISEYEDEVSYHLKKKYVEYNETEFQNRFEAATNKYIGKC